MSQFIKLTSAHHGTFIMVRKDFIGHIVEDSYEKRGYQIPCTRVVLTTNNNGGMIVRESAEEIFELMEMPAPETNFTKKVANRMELIMDDVVSLRNYINGDTKSFSESDKDEMITHLNNIEIASDLTDTEADRWYVVKD